MGYQESYIITEKEGDFAKLCDYFKLHELWSSPTGQIQLVETITLLQPISGNYEYMGHPDKSYRFPAGARFLYIVGERSSQSNIYNLLNLGEIRPPENEINWIKNVQIIFTEVFPGEAIFGENNLNPIAKHEAFIFE